jgi:hypothetical protein
MYVFQSYADHPMNGRFCEIVARSTMYEDDGIEPGFVVVFNNGRRAEVLGTELRPWYPAG